MGGDYAPEAVVKGVVESLALLDATTTVVLFGDKEAIERCLEAEGYKGERIEIVATSEVIAMGDHPVKAFQSKADSSIRKGFEWLKAGKIDGIASAGSTGAMMVGSMLVPRPIDGVLRPTIATTLPTLAGTPVIILDIGLNVDCRPEVLEQYALIGSVYAESVLGIGNPRVALLNIGEEVKG